MVGRIKTIFRKNGIVATPSYSWTASSADSIMFVNSTQSALRVRAIVARVEVAGTGGAATASLVKCASGTAIGSGTVLHTGSINLAGTAATNQTLTLSTTAAALVIPPGTAIAIDFTGTLTSAVGVVTVDLVPA